MNEILQKEKGGGGGGGGGGRNFGFWASLTRVVDKAACTIIAFCKDRRSN